MRRFLIKLIIIAVIILTPLKLAQQLEKRFLDASRRPPLWVVLLSSIGKGNIGTGSFGKTPNRLDLSLLQPGDILLGGNKGGSYGKYTHAGLFIGNNQVIEMYISTGVYLTEAETYHRYTWAAILRVKATPRQKMAAVNYAKSQLGTPFFILTPKNDNGLWYCSKLIWYAYLKQGINLEPFKSFWITPDDFLYSEKAQIIAYSSAG